MPDFPTDLTPQKTNPQYRREIRQPLGCYQPLPKRNAQAVALALSAFGAEGRLEVVTRTGVYLGRGWFFRGNQYTIVVPLGGQYLDFKTKGNGKNKEDKLKRIYERSKVWGLLSVLRDTYEDKPWWVYVHRAGEGEDG